MKTRYILLLICLLAWSLHHLAVTQIEAVAACKKAGIQTDETCKLYTH